jgi:two-component system, sensor histidine kinase
MPGQSIDNPFRLEALADTELLDSLPDESFDRFTRLAHSILNADISLITLVDQDRQFFMSECGLGEPLCSERQNDISYSFCRFVVEGGEPFIVENASQDPRVQRNPAVTELGVMAYLGMPISTPDGYLLGSLCAVGTVPRKWSPADLKNLSDLAAAVCREVELSEQSTALQRALRLSETRHNEQDRNLHTIVHDLRTPAGAISSCMELLSMDSDGFSDETLELIEMSRESTESLLNMIQQILAKGHDDQSGRSSLEVRPVSLSLMLRRIARILRPFAQDAQVSLNFSWPEELIHIMVDERLIERVFMNLLTNAVKYSPSGGSVKIRTEFVGSSENPMCRICVIDQGPGVPDSEKDYIFEEYAVGSTQSNRGMASFGIGLSFCKTVITTHGGRIGVEDATGGGSIFYCILPLAAAGQHTDQHLLESKVPA